MMLTLLTVAAVCVGLTTLYVLVARDEQVEVLAGETTISASADASETLVTGRHLTVPVTRTDWKLTTVSALSDAEDLLDTLENQGVSERELVVMGNSCFAVRWR